MMKTLPVTGLFMLLILLVTTSCATQKATNTSGSASADIADRDGSSFERAIIVKSISEEYAWVRQQYPGSQFLRQELVFQGKKPFDVLTVKLEDGTQKKFYFDVSSFFGKF